MLSVNSEDPGTGRGHGHPPGQFARINTKDDIDFAFAGGMVKLFATGARRKRRRTPYKKGGEL